MKEKKLNSLEALGQLRFDNLAAVPENLPEPEDETPIQHLEAHFSNKGRAGKTVTIIKGFKGENEELKALAKTLKQHVGTGGSVKDGDIIIQGNYREVIMEKLKELGYSVKRVGG